MATVLIAGCGRVGLRLAGQLASEHNVHGLRRSSGPMPSGVKLWRADLLDPDTLTDPPCAFDYVFYTASADRREPKSYIDAYIKGPRNLMRHLNQAAIRHAFFTSSTAVYGQNDGQVVDEESVTEPSGFNGEILLQAEQAFSQMPFGTTIVRLSGIYGGGSTRLIDRVARGEQPATLKITNRIHVDDCAGVLAHLLSMQTRAPLYLGSDTTPAPMSEVVGWMARNMNAPKPPEPAEATEDLGKRCNVARLLATGYAFTYPSYKEGYASIMDGLNQSD